MSSFCKTSLLSLLAPCQGGTLSEVHDSTSLSSLFSSVAQFRVFSIIFYMPKETDVGHQVKHLKSIVSCQGCKGGLSQKLILSMSSSRNLP